MASDILPVEEEEEVEQPSASYAAALDEIKRRCAARNIEYEQASSDDGTTYVGGAAMTTWRNVVAET